MSDVNPPPPTNGPHHGQPVYSTGKRLEKADAAMVLIHGRGASARDILTLAAEFNNPDFAYLAPEARSGAWYPNRFLDPTISNEPWLSSALALVERVMKHVAGAGIPPEKTVLLGFSQGACLALEYAARHPAKYGGLVGLSGGLIGAENELTGYHGSLEGTPVFLGCSTTDPHIPEGRVQQTAEILQGLGGAVDMRLYPNMDHTINQDEVQAVAEMMKTLTGG